MTRVVIWFEFPWIRGGSEHSRTEQDLAWGETCEEDFQELRSWEYCLLSGRLPPSRALDWRPPCSSFSSWRYTYLLTTRFGCATLWMPSLWVKCNWTPPYHSHFYQRKSWQCSRWRFVAFCWDPCSLSQQFYIYPIGLRSWYVLDRQTF